ncbi:hypothetical protein [Xenophilus sp. Marseille-Q4582]|uniref:hypothetical protein n=1 Tax=Xenophilus sp. Marseille-Q4582 TaxID=2866600 RepID=UPI001CE43656|nr:hypothetical protein [Xenophilus sp. Marseille-Q4582]
MRHILFETSDSYSVAVLIKHTSFNKADVGQHYFKPLAERGVPAGEVIAFNLTYNEANKAPAALIKDYLSQLLPELNALGVKFLYVADASYFKVLAGQSKADPHFGYNLPCKVKGFEHMRVILGVNHHQLIHNPSVQQKLDLSLDTLAQVFLGTYSPLSHVASDRGHG